MVTALPLWQFALKSRPDEEERAFRDHFLDSDIRHLSFSIYVISAIIIALVLLDLTQLAEQPELLPGFIVKVTFFFMTLAVYFIVNRIHLASVLDVSVIIYTSIFASGAILSYVLNDYSATRMTAIVAMCIFTAHVAFPVYASYLLPCIAILVLGESAILLTTERADLILERPLMLITFLFATALSMLASTLRQRTRYISFKAMEEVQTLSGFLPICANCKQIRDDQGYYQAIESYIAERSRVVFSHGICPSCKDESYGDYLARKKAKREQKAGNQTRP